VEIISALVVVIVVVAVFGLCHGHSSGWSRPFYSVEVVVVVGGGVSRELSCSESVLRTTNCPLVLVIFSGHFYTVVTLHLRIQSVFLIRNKIHA
jgi:hypothetical protein